jgi:hypothetical protein
MIHGAVPVGSMRTAGQAQFMAAARASPYLAPFRVDRWDSCMRVAKALAMHADWVLGTSRPGWAALMAEARVTHSTLARRLVDLQRAGLLGVVATGRTAGTDPADPEAGNMAAVYVLAVPRTLQTAPAATQDPNQAPEPDDPAPVNQHGGAHQDDQDEAAANPSSPLTRADAPVDENDTPSLSLSVTAKAKPPHAREANQKPKPRNPETNAERASSPSAVRGLTRAQLIAAGQLCGTTEKALWTKNSRLLAAAELCRRDPVLGRLSVADVASLCREFFLASYSVRDILTAINTRPDGSPWPHQLTVAAIVDVRGWTRYRLNAWRQNPLDHTSPPGRSPSARIEAEQRRARARAQARAEAEAEARAAAACPCSTCNHGPAEPASPAASDMAAARARLRANRLTSKHRNA